MRLWFHCPFNHFLWLDLFFLNESQTSTDASKNDTARERGGDRSVDFRDTKILNATLTNGHTNSDQYMIWKTDSEKQTQTNRRKDRNRQTRSDARTHRRINAHTSRTTLAAHTWRRPCQKIHFLRKQFIIHANSLLFMTIIAIKLSYHFGGFSHVSFWQLFFILFCFQLCLQWRRK